MQKKYAFLLTIAMACFLLASSGNPPNGKTGAPGEGTCNDCHTLNGGTQDGVLTLSGFPATITPNQSYVLTITNSNPNGIANEAGFQMVVLNSSNNNAGDFTSPGPNSTTQTNAGREYWEHNPSQPYPGNNMVTWTVTWTAPSGPANETITWYAAGNMANANNQDSGDLVVLANGSGVMESGVDPLQVDIITSTNVSCNGGSDGSATAGATGGTPPYSYSWSNGQNGATATNLSAGMYTVTVTDNMASTATTNVSITQPSAVAFTAPAITGVSCFGGNDGAITAGASGGVPPYTFDWSNGTSGPTASGLAAGTYGVTVADANGCTKNTSYTVTQPAVLSINLVDLVNESCFGASDGSITISASGGTAPFFAEWSNGDIGNVVNGLEPGSYSVTVTDNNDCTATAMYSIAAGNMVDVDLLEQVNVTCAGGSNGSIEVAGTGGASPYAYAWSNGSNLPLVTGLSAGNYLLTVTDSDGCGVIKLYTITEPAPIVVSVSQTQSIQCAGDSTAALLAQVTSGGTAPFTVNWSTGNTGSEVTGLPAGNYIATVTDASGCTGTAEFVVSEPQPVAATVITSDETAPGANDGSAAASGNGGTPGYTFLWSTGETTETIAGLAPGVYTVTVTDANGCTSVASGQVDPFGCSLEVILGDDLLVCEGTQVTLVSLVSGETGNVTYAWSTGDTTETITVLAPGEYCVTVTDEAGCQDADCIFVSIDIVPLLSCGVMGESAPGANDGSITCEPNPAIAAYLWSTGATTPSITGLAPGDYCVTLTNMNGCFAVQCFVVQPADCNLVITAIIEDVLCFGDTTGSVSVNAENAALPVTYFWSTGDTTATLNDLGAGSYDVTISDAVGCFSVQSYAVSQPAGLSITVDSILPIAEGQSGAIFITVSGGVPPYTYTWTYPGGATSSDEDPQGLTEAGGYIITVTDANACGVVGLFEVTSTVAVPTVPRPKQVTVYPVPATDWLQLVMETPAQQVWLTGIDGRVLRQFDSPSGNRIDVSGLESGWYVLTMFDGTSWYAARMVK